MISIAKNSCDLPSDLHVILTYINRIYLNDFNFSVLDIDGIMYGYLRGRDDLNPHYLQNDSGVVEVWNGVERSDDSFTTLSEAITFFSGIYYILFQGPTREEINQFLLQAEIENDFDLPVRLLRYQPIRSRPEPPKDFQFPELPGGNNPFW